MMLCLQQQLVVGLVLVAVVSGYETVEGKYKGEKYQPASRPNLNHQHSRSTLDSDSDSSFSSRSFSGFGSESRATPGIFGTLIKQLSSALHRRIVGLSSGGGSAKKGAKGGAKEKKGKGPRSFIPKNITKKGEPENDLYYHYYPHNQHLFNLPECATQQVCNAVYVRLNFTQPLCACPALSNPCSASYLSNDQHSIELKMSNTAANAVTLVKTCEPVWSVRECRKPRDWAILALQNTRTGKAHYLVICKCSNSGKLEGPLNHDQPTYAQVPGIRVYGMMCTMEEKRAKRDIEDEDSPEFPWWRIQKAIRDEKVIRDLMDDDAPTNQQDT